MTCILCLYLVNKYGFTSNIKSYLTTILRMVLNIHWKNKIKNEIPYGELERLLNKIIRRTLKFAAIAYE